MNERVNIPAMCDKHVTLLIQQAGYTVEDPWRALLVMAQVSLFQAASCDDKLRERSGGDVHKLATFGCLACLKPDAFGEIVAAAETHELGAIKALGDRWVSEKTSL